MAKSIIIDPGHGGTDPGAIGFGVREKDWNLRISLYQYERLKELGANVAITRTTDVTLDSVPRTNKIKNKYDYCISNHWNAFNGSARGVETIHSIFSNGRFAKALADAIVKASGLPLRRVFKKGNSVGTDWYFMHRLTGNTETVIIEYGFLDNQTDHNWYKNEANFYKVAEAVIEAVCKEIGITYKAKGQVAKPSVPKGTPGKLYKVQAGAFKNKENAENLHERMERAGIDAFVVRENGLYKVQAGAYSVKENAEVQLKKVSKLVGDGFIVETGSTSPAPQPKPAPKPQPQVKTLHLPRTAATWRIYKPGGPYVANSSGQIATRLSPAKYGGLSYVIKGNPMAHVYLIDTRDFGRVAIYAHPSTGATIK